jgi:hypothetical protein
MDLVNAIECLEAHCTLAWYTRVQASNTPLRKLNPQFQNPHIVIICQGYYLKPMPRRPIPDTESLERWLKTVLAQDQAIKKWATYIPPGSHSHRNIPD